MGNPMDSRFDSVMESVEYVEEGINMDTAAMIHDPKVRRMRLILRYAIKAYKAAEFEEAAKAFKESNKLCIEMKTKVDAAPEPEKMGEKILSHLTPVLTIMPRTDTKVIGNVTITTYYPDVMSTTTKSGVKQSIQERFNRFAYILSEWVKLSQKAKTKYDKKKKEAEREGNIDKFNAKYKKKKERLEAFRSKYNIKL